jgi:lipopolysaccharide export system permease protein
MFIEQQTYTRKWVTRKWRTELTPEVLTLNILPAEALSAGSLNDHIDYLEERKADSAKYRLAFWSKVLQPLAIFSLVLVGIAFVFGPLRQATVGFRVFVGVLFGISFKLLSDILGPLSIVFEMPPVLAVLAPIVICFAIGLFLLKRAG